jgi:hypothetical protein
MSPPPVTLDPVTAVFPVDPADVPEDAVRAVKRTLYRYAGTVTADPMDDHVARVLVAVVIAALTGPPGQAH